MEPSWSIYVLTNDVIDFYVGRTTNTKSRLANHKRRFGARIGMRILQTGCGKSAGMEAETYWIMKFGKKTSSGVGGWPDGLRKQRWDGISKEDRSRIATERNKVSWAKRTPDEREAKMSKLRAGRTPEKLKDHYSALGKANMASPGHKEKLAAARCVFWASLKGDERTEFYAKRAAKNLATRKRNQGQR